uniref:Uncharacterized protein n=1 Tax=viral metagenome TaxID=1070528 RepID=A0A6C0B1R7_9ZZZZ
MAAVGGPAVPLGRAAGLAAAPVAAVAAPVAAVAGPGGLVPFNVVNVLAGATIPGYELPWNNYDTHLKASLTANYSLVVEPEARAPRAAPVVAAPAGAAPAGADPLGVEIGRMNTYIKANRPPNWSNSNISNLLRAARTAVLIPYDPANPGPYRAAFNAFLDVQVNQTTAGIPAARVVGHINIGP